MADMASRTCRCGEVFEPWGMTAKNPHGRYECRHCDRARSRRYYRENREYILADKAVKYIDKKIEELSDA